jgi:cytosine/adenosine deaminase-related metal-dependent hydrolase
LLADALLLGGLAYGYMDRVHSQPAPGAPTRGEYLIRNAYVMTMDAELGDLAGADLHVRNGEILAVGAQLRAPDAEPIDGDGMIVLPGFIETHWHMWTTMLRSMAGDRDEHGYFPTSRGIGAFYTARDMYRSTRLAAAEAVHSGITFVHDWCHNVRGPEFAEAGLRALGEAGLRGRFSYGTPTGLPGDLPIDRSDLARLARNWSDYSNEGLLTLGLAWRGAGTEASRADYAAARELGLPVSVHVNNFPTSAGGIAAIAERGMLGPDVQLIHAIWTSPEELAAVAASGASVSLSPFTELRIGFGFPLTSDFLDAGIDVGLSVDTPALSGNADMFGIMKVIQNIENGRAQDEFKLPARRVLELATIQGARSMGVDGTVGSLVAGKRADLIMVNTRHINLGVFTEPAHLLVEAAQPSNVDTVMIDGRILKRRGQLTAVDTETVMAEAEEAQAAVRQRAGWW